MSVKSDQKTPSIDPQVLNQLLAGKKAAGEIEDLLKDLRKEFIEHAIQGELTVWATRSTRPKVVTAAIREGLKLRLNSQRGWRSIVLI